MFFTWSSRGRPSRRNPRSASDGISTGGRSKNTTSARSIASSISCGLAASKLRSGYLAFAESIRVSSSVQRLDAALGEREVELCDDVRHGDQAHGVRVAHALSPAQRLDRPAELAFDRLGILVDDQMLAEVWARAQAVRGRVEADDRRAHGGGHRSEEH